MTGLAPGHRRNDRIDSRRIGLLFGVARRATTLCPHLQHQLATEVPQWRKG
jgi:hypothetical protein